MGSNCCCIGTIVAVVLVIVAVVVIFLCMGGSYESQVISATRALRTYTEGKDYKENSDEHKKLTKTLLDAIEGLAKEYSTKKAEDDAKLFERLKKEKYTGPGKDAKEEPLFPEIEKFKTAIEAARSKQASEKDAKKEAKKEEKK